MELKECTFKPVIIKTNRTEQRKPAEVVDNLFKWSQNVKNKIVEKRVQRNKQETSGFYKINNKENITAEGLSRGFDDGRLSFRTIAPNDLTIDLDITSTINDTSKIAPVSTKANPIQKKYRNKSFNVLLDMIQ
jgi:hypothetical protein